MSVGGMFIEPEDCPEQVVVCLNAQTLGEKIAEGVTWKRSDDSGEIEFSHSDCSYILLKATRQSPESAVEFIRSVVAAIIDKAVADEREACENEARCGNNGHDPSERIATAIRGRGK